MSKLNTFMRWLNSFGSTVAFTSGNPHYARGYGQTVSGAVINEQSALTIPAFFHALRLYGQTIGSLEWNLIQHDPDRRKSVARNHPVHRLIHDEPNEFQLPSAFRETILGHAISYGNGYAFIERNGNMRPTALMPLMPFCTYPERRNGELVYVTTVNGQPQTLQPWQVFHIAGFSVNGLTGVPLVQLMKETLGLTKAEEQFAASYFGNGANYGGTVEVPGRLSPEAMGNLKSQVSDNAGLGNAFKWLFLEEGMKATQSDSNADKAQLVESRQFQLGDLARIVGLPPHLLMDLSRSTNNNIEHQGIEAVTYSFKPWANKLMQEANRKLLYEVEKGTLETIIDLKPLMQGDAKTQAERDQIRFNTASMTPNEIRELDGRNPIEGGDQLFINIATLPLNLAIQQVANNMAAVKAKADATTLLASKGTDPSKAGIDTAPEDTTNDDATPQGGATFSDGPKVDPKEIDDAAGYGLGPTRATPDRSALRPVVADIVGRLMRREIKAVKAGIAKLETANATPEIREAWLAKHADETRAHAIEVLGPIVETLKSFGVDRSAAEAADAFTTQTKKDLPAIFLAADDSTYERWTKDRAEEMISQLTA